MNLSLQQPTQRIQSIDMVRGIVMIIMALDHVRDFFHLTAFTDEPTNLATTIPALFFTRWITHFCAPVFVFLSGTSAYLAAQKKSKNELSFFLLKRGLWLVFIELSVITLGWTFNPLYNLFAFGVIWAIGWSMIILGLLVRTSFSIIVATGCIIFFGHNILDYIKLPQEGIESILLHVFLTTPIRFYQVGANHFIADIYAILPWTAVMLLGYGFGYFFRPSVSMQQRKKILLISGTAAMLIFIILRFINEYGDPYSWSQQRNGLYTFFSFINTTKYPCSLLYLCMTLGPAFIALAFLEQVQNRLGKIFIMYGRVPFFYYVCHLYLIHIICVIFFFVSGNGADKIVDRNTPFLFRPLDFGFNLWVVYLVWLFAVVALYWPCRWFNRYKSTHRQWWLSYV